MESHQGEMEVQFEEEIGFHHRMQSVIDATENMSSHFKKQFFVYLNLRHYHLEHKFDYRNNC